MAERFKTKPKILFGPGSFRAHGGEFVQKSDADCAAMVLNYHELAEQGVLPRVKVGHKDGDETGAPKLGVLTDAWVDPAGNRIVGPLGDLPEELAQAIERGEYDKVSIEFSDHWWDEREGKFRDNVITGIAVLGAKWPAYKDQPDNLTIARSQMADAGGEGVSVYTLSMADMEVVDTDEGGGEDVEDKERKELLEKIAKLEGEITELKAAQPDEEKDALEAKVADLTKKLELATKAQKAADEKIADAEVKAKEDVVEGVLKEAVTADAEGNVKMTPDEAEVQKPVLMSMDDSRTIKLSEGKDGGEDVMASPFEQACQAIRDRRAVLKLAEKSVDDSDDLHKGTDKDEHKLSDTDREVAKGMGVDEADMERVTAPGFDMTAELKREDKKDEKE